MSRRPGTPATASLSANHRRNRGGGPGLLFSLRVPCALSPTGQHEIRLGRDGEQITYLAADCGAGEGDAATRLGAKTCSAMLADVKRRAFDGDVTVKNLDSLLKTAAEDALTMGAGKRSERERQRVLEGGEKYGTAAPHTSHAAFVARLRELRLECGYNTFGAADWKSALLAKTARCVTGFADLKADYERSAITAGYGNTVIVRRTDRGWTLGDSVNARSFGRAGKRCTVCDRTFLAVGGHLNSEPHRTAVAARLMKLVNWLNKARKRSGVVPAAEAPRSSVLTFEAAA